MARYLISFERGAMDHIPAEDFPQVVEDSHAAIQEIRDAGVFVFGGGLDYDDMEPAVVSTDGIVTEGPYPATKELVGGLTIVDVPTREEALKWAAKIAVACRCAQDVREFGYDPEA
ncbi:hypothetical protein E0H75_16780 [Kribbella capetownensis]|uniref:YCII-related domain-containing protein n=1 Tax=Kribbella capetownensis TaxID=1572659 RepID=A0A4R0K4R6_9ACTN|nr:YciI family protein [Kribbella capetownensis]TCC49955.1 hypothetical protein E0H75_16780 [Kribbella capetownensis]